MRVLVAEDHESLGRSLADGLREEGFAVDLTFNGTEAHTLARTNPYDLIVLDIMLPGMDGFALLPQLRRAKINSPVLCLTARDGVEDRVKGLDLGADDYLVKPFAWPELIARCRALIRRGHNQRNPEIVVGDLRIDTVRKAVSRAEKPIKLSAREYALLTYLANREGQIVTRSEIWQHLYDAADGVASNVVDVYIAYLRNKIDKGYPKRLIHTRHGQGYLLAVEDS
jgi:DNA-binding response OmpR family regulator